VGALLDAKAIHGGRSARSHLLCLAQTNNLPRRRVDEVLEIVGMQEVAGKRSKGFSLGMGQRLGIATALLGDPAILMFDEPVNGLDPDGILWIRNLMKALAAEGRTAFVSSHLMSEMENTADRLIVIGRGKLIADCTVTESIAAHSRQKVRVRTSQPELLAKLAAWAGGTAANGSYSTSELAYSSSGQPVPPATPPEHDGVLSRPRFPATDGLAIRAAQPVIIERRSGRTAVQPGMERLDGRARIPPGPRERPAAGEQQAGHRASGLQRPQHDRPEVLHVLGEQPSLLHGRPGEQAVVGHRPQLNSLGHRDDVVPQLAQRGRDRRREHLVKREPASRRATHAMSCCCTRHAASALADASSASAISASISSRYSP
jgi:ABC transporter